MVNKGLLFVLLLFSSLFIGGKKIEADCTDCGINKNDSIIWAKSTIYLDSLRSVALKVVVDKKLKVDSLQKETLQKDKIITAQNKKINRLHEELFVIKQNSKEEVIEKKDTVIKKTFLQRIGVKK